MARGLNNHNELAGDSQLDEDSFMSLWQPHQGDFTVTDLSTQIPTKPVWDLALGFDLNDDTWLAGEGRKFKKGRYGWHAVLVVPNP